MPPPLSHRIAAHAAADAHLPRVEDDSAIVSSFLSDAAHVPGGFAAGVAFPTSTGEVAALVAGATSVLPVGAQSSLTGGATPRGELILSTRAGIEQTRAAKRALDPEWKLAPGVLFPPTRDSDGRRVPRT